MVQMFHGTIPSGGTVDFQLDADYQIGVCNDPHSGALGLNVLVNQVPVITVPAGNVSTINGVAGQFISLNANAISPISYVIAFDGTGNLVANVV